MRRRLIKQGIGALTITLPKEWVSRYNLKTGDEIEIEEHDKNLLLKADGESSISNKTEINIDNLNQQLIWRYIASAYRLGYDEIMIKFSDIKKVYDVKFASLIFLEKKARMDTHDVIRDAVNRFIGLEIIDQGKDYFIIKDLGQTSEKEFNNTIRRIFLLLLSMADESLHSLEKSEDMKNSVISSDINIDKFSDFCLRILNKKGYEKVKKTNSMYTLIFTLESVGDEYKKIALHIDEKEKYSKDLISLYQDINEVLHLFYDLFYKFSNERILRISDLHDRITAKINILNLNDKEKEILHHLKKIKRYIVDLLQLKIDIEI